MMFTLFILSGIVFAPPSQAESLSKEQPRDTSGFSLISPENEEWIYKKVLLDWEDSTDPELSAYTVLISEFTCDYECFLDYDCGENSFENANRIEELKESVCILGFGDCPELENSKTYCWKVQAISEFGDVLQESDVRKFRTKPSGDNRGWIKCYVRDALTGQEIRGADVRFGNTVLKETSPGLYSEGIVPGKETLTVKAAGYEQGSDEVEVLSQDVQTRTFELTPTRVATPVLLPPPGSFTESQDVEISCSTPDAVISYTTNGQEPAEDSDKYTAPISLEVTTIIKVKAYREEMEASETVTGIYYIATLKDIISTLQILAGLSFSPFQEFDVNDDNKKGLAEAVFFLQKIAEAGK
ncbi:chitobiase/beta-hexosaminidase C-terminal domain-containing protein [Desulfococcaceae bacterium HSG8]|nr:chitobiase/beta-hexosaminidase C-terminal domain-containing protein [Desulfococcaceae bacterium HSG8]